MSLPKAQLVDPKGNMNLPGMTATGIVTATSLKGVTTGSVTNLTGSPDLDVGIVTGSSFVGDGTGHAANITGTPELNLGVTTATSFVGDAVGKAAGLTGTPNLNVGLITATSFVGFVTGNVTGNISGLAASITPGANLGVGVCTAIQYHGDGSALTGTATSAYIAQNITASGAETIIDLSYGNVIYYDSSSNTTVGFASTSAAEQITLIRDAGNSYTITWPSTVRWNGGTTPTLFQKSGGYQVFRLTTVDTGTTYQAWEDSASPDGYGMYVYGYNSGGSLGLNDAVDRSSPTQVGTSFDFTGLWRGANSNQGIFRKGTNDLFMAGFNSSGALGQNNTVSRYSSPIQIPGTWTRAFSGENVGMAHKDGGMWMWGQGNYGQLGFNNRASLSSPTQLPGTWSSSDGKGCIGNGATYAIKTNGTLWSWGRNFTGILGHNEGGTYPAYSASKSSPTQVGTNTNWNQMFHADTTAVSATKTDGTLWSWGYNGSGQLGQNSAGAPAQKSSPVQIPGTTWSRVFMLNNCCVATKTNGTLWGWGSNNYGSLGQNEGGSPATKYSSPVQIPGAWTHGSLEGSWNGGGFCKKTDGTLWCWGWNGAGQLGLNDRVSHSSPVQVSSYSDAWVAYGMIGGGRNAIIK